MSTLEQDIISMAGPRCPDFEPGCTVCEAWLMFDCHAYQLLGDELAEVEAWYADWNREIEEAEASSK